MNLILGSSGGGGVHDKVCWVIAYMSRGGQKTQREKNSKNSLPNMMKKENNVAKRPPHSEKDPIELVPHYTVDIGI